MKILNATIFDTHLEKGTSTKPWVVFLSDEGQERRYVVKLFTTRQIEQQFPVAKEVICNIIATQLGLNVPNFALANFSKDFVEHILGDKEREILAKKDSGLKFASQLQDGMITFSPTLHRTFIRPIDFANIFAFDCLVYNLDRGKNPEKPNLLVEDDNYLLFDHEQTFPFIDNLENLYLKIIENLRAYQLDYMYRQHLLFPYLQVLRTSQKGTLFDEFEASLANINVEEIENCFKEMVDLNISVGYYQRIIDYLYMIKNNTKLFINSLYAAIK